MNFVETLSKAGKALKLDLVYPKDARQVINIFNNKATYIPTIDYIKVESISIKVDIKINNMVPATLEMDLSELDMLIFNNFDYNYDKLHVSKKSIMCQFNDGLFESNNISGFCKYYDCHINHFNLKRVCEVDYETTADTFDNPYLTVNNLYQYVKGKTPIILREPLYYFTDKIPISILDSEVKLIITTDFKVDQLPSNISELKIKNGCSIDIGDNLIKVLTINTSDTIYIDFDQLSELKMR